MSELCVTCGGKLHLDEVHGEHTSALDCVDHLRQRLAAAEEAIQYALDHVVSETAGLDNNLFAYLWTRDWKEFKRLAGAAKGGRDA